MDLKFDIGAFLKDFISRKKSGDSAGPEQNLRVRYLGAGIALALIIGGYLYFFYFPQQKEIRQMQALIDSTWQIKEEILSLDRQILLKQVELDEGNARFEELNRLFHNKQELEDLYRNISLLALTYELLVATLEKGTEEPVLSDKPPINQGEGVAPLREVAFYKISVKFQFVGNYLSYTNFRRDLAQQKKLINIDRESIKVLPAGGDNSAEGTVEISATLSTFRFPATDAERFLTGS